MTLLKGKRQSLEGQAKMRLARPLLLKTTPGSLNAIKLLQCVYPVIGSTLLVSSGAPIFYVTPLWKAKMSSSFCLGTRMFIRSPRQPWLSGRSDNDTIPLRSHLGSELWPRGMAAVQPFFLLGLQEPVPWNMKVEKSWAC